MGHDFSKAWVTVTHKIWKSYPIIKNRRFQKGDWIRINEFREAMKREQKRILRLADLTADAGNLEEQGVLILDKRGENIYCYQRDDQHPKKYIGKADSDAAKEFLRNRYLREKRSRLITDQQLVENMMQEYQDYSYDKYGGTDSEAIYRIALEVERLFYAE